MTKDESLGKEKGSMVLITSRQLGVVGPPWEGVGRRLVHVELR